MKKNLLNLLAVTILGVVIASCSGPSKMARDVNWLSDHVTPDILEVVADEITSNYSMSFLDGYFHPKAILEIIPVLVYQGGEEVGPSFKLQGEKVADNYQVVPRSGGRVANSVKFAYKPGMEKSHLELRMKVWDNNKSYDFPRPFKIADGAVITYKLIEQTLPTPTLMADNYQKVITEQKETQILYNINSHKVNPKELTKNEIKEFQDFLASVEKDDRSQVKATNVIAYASPDGPLKYNEKLSAKRGETAKSAFDQVAKEANLSTPLSVTTIAEDWDGFQELVAASNIQDKELILRVLSMYSDPIVREREIRNMSFVFKTLADKVLPKLRRARMVADISYANLTDQELIQKATRDINSLDEEALLYAASLIDNYNTQKALYNKAGEKFNSDRAYNNLAALALANNKVAEAKAALAKVTNKTTAYYNNNSGLLAIAEKDYNTAARLLASSSLPNAQVNSATLDILQGRYNDAASKLNGTNTETEALSYILINQLDMASKTLNTNTPFAAYLRAIIAARKGEASEVKRQLNIASQDPFLKERAKTDIEFAKFL